MNTKTFVTPSWPELYIQHLPGKHPVKWAVYKSLPDDNRSKLSANEIPLVNIIPNQFIVSSYHIYFHIDIPIIELIMKKLPLDPVDEEQTIEKVLRVFVFQQGKNVSMSHYWSHINNLNIFKLVIV